MGLLTTGGAPMKWGTPENQRAIPHVVEHGVLQFINIFFTKRHLDHFPFLWGEEVEHQLVKVDPEARTVRLSLNAAEVLETLKGKDEAVDWRPEYGSFMVESVPMRPYSDALASLVTVERNIARRYELLDTHSGPGVLATTLVQYPLMGVGAFSTATDLSSPYSQSLFVPDACINASHPRFATLTQNIRLRRHRKVCIQVPLFMDTYTMERTVDKKLGIDFTPINDSINCAADDAGKKKKTSKFTSGSDAAAKQQLEQQQQKQQQEHQHAEGFTHLYTPATDYYYAQYAKGSKEVLVNQRYEACPCPVPSVRHPCIYMDCMAFGMGCHCLQVTMQLPNMSDARYIYDQLAILCPAFLAITSATVVQKGLLCDSDVRWLTIAASVDDRRREEVPRLIKSRYDSVSLFISDRAVNLALFNDEHVEVNANMFRRLIHAKVDAGLATHIAHLFIRDPLVMYDQMIDIDDATHNEHFENIQSTNWQTMRFKPPSPDPNDPIGWRVEFRVMDVMPTPFENAAFSIFAVLLTKAIHKYNCSFYTRMTAVDENVGRAHKRDPCNELYVMRKDIFTAIPTANDDEFTQLNVNEIFNGKAATTAASTPPGSASPDAYFGLIPLVTRYLAELPAGSYAPDHMFQLYTYIEFIAMRAAGEIPTTAQYLRRFITSHADYKHDSRVSEAITFDMVQKIHGLSNGTIVDEAYLPMKEFAARAARALGNSKRARE